MSPINPLYLERELKRFTRPNAHLFVRPDWRRFVRPGFENDHPFALYERKYRPDQARVPAGSREGGQWTDEGGQGPASPASADGNLSLERPHPVQLTERERSLSSERLKQAGGESLGSFGESISIVKGPGISHQESFDPETGITTLSFTGIGSVVVDEKVGNEVTRSVYSVGTQSRPDVGLNITIDLSGKVRAYRTVGA